MNENKTDELMSVDDLKLLKELITSLDENNEVFKMSSLVIKTNENVKKQEKSKIKNILEGEKKI